MKKIEIEKFCSQTPPQGDILFEEKPRNILHRALVVIIVLKGSPKSFEEREMGWNNLTFRDVRKLEFFFFVSIFCNLKCTQRPKSPDESEVSYYST